MVRCIELGAEDYLPKPCDPVLLRLPGSGPPWRRNGCAEPGAALYLRSVATVTGGGDRPWESGAFNEAALAEVSERPDALGQLARVFTHMASEVQRRARRMEQEMKQLRIEIDETRKARQVVEITGTDYFQSLREKAAQLRRRAQKLGESGAWPRSSPSTPSGAAPANPT